MAAGTGKRTRSSHEHTTATMDGTHGSG
jgi:hypothetical protein